MSAADEEAALLAIADAMEAAEGTVTSPQVVFWGQVARCGESEVRRGVQERLRRDALVVSVRDLYARYRDASCDEFARIARRAAGRTTV